MLQGQCETTDPSCSLLKGQMNINCIIQRKLKEEKNNIEVCYLQHCQLNFLSFKQDSLRFLYNSRTLEHEMNRMTFCKNNRPIIRYLEFNKCVTKENLSITYIERKEEPIRVLERIMHIVCTYKMKKT